MKVKVFTLSICCYFLIYAASAQITISGKVFSLPERQVIAYANIGIINSVTGTISDHDGSYTITILPKYFQDTLVFSALGYEKVDIPISALKTVHDLTIYLKETAYELAEVIVKGDRIKSKSFAVGNANLGGSSVYGDTVNAGSAMALLIHNRTKRDENKFEYPAFVHAAEVFIGKNTFAKFKVRVRLYDVVLKNGKPQPGKDLLNESVVMESQIVEGWLSFDLSTFRVQVDDDFFLAFEWILEKSDREVLYTQFEKFKKEHPDKVTTDYSMVDGKRIAYQNFLGNFYFGTSFGISVDPSIIKNNICFYRLNSFGTWYASPSILTARVQLSTSPGHLTQQAKGTTSEPVINDLRSFYKVRLHSLPEDSLDSSEHQEADRQYFAIRKSEPLEIQVLRNENRLNFSAINQTYYPYRLTLQFSNVANLEPLISSKHYLIAPGKTQLLNLKVVYPDVDNYHYELAVSEALGDTTRSPHYSFPYTLPVKFMRGNRMDRSNYDLDFFDVEKSDTIYAMRKGIVTCVPGTLQDIDKISAEPSLEILHPDGTVMVFQGLDTTSILCNPGEVVFPGEALSISSTPGQISVSLFEILPDERLKKIPIHYFIDDEKIFGYPELLRNLDFIDRVLPDSIKEREMTEKEKRDWRRRKL